MRNDRELVAVPPGVVTVIEPVLAPVGTVALMAVLELTENEAPVPAKATAVAPVNPVPLIVTCVPTGPLVGLNVEIVGAVGGGGAVVTVKLPALVPVPPGVVTAIGPDVA